MTASAWGVDHGEVSKAWRSDEPKFKGTIVDSGQRVDRLNVQNTGKKSLIRRRPKYRVTAFSSKTEPGSAARIAPLRTKAVSGELKAHLKSGKTKSKQGSFTVVGKAADWQSIGQRELKASKARRRQRTANTATSAGAGAALAGFISRPEEAKQLGRITRSAAGVARAGQPKAAKAMMRGAVSRNPVGAVTLGGAALAAGGTSAWGVARGQEAYQQRKINQRRRRNAGVAKSYVPGKGYEPAAKLGVKGLRKVVRPGQYKSRGLDERQKTISEAIRHNRSTFLGADEGVRGKDGVIRTARTDLPPGVAGMAWKKGGKDGKRMYVYNPAASSTVSEAKGVQRHELAHVSPKKRTEWRMGTIVTDSKKSAREEARAEMAAGEFYRDKTKGFRSAYNDVARSPKTQRRAGAQTKIGVGLNRMRRDGDFIERATGTQKVSDRMSASVAGRFGAGWSSAYRSTQDKIAGSKGIKVPKSKDQRLRGVAIDSAGAAAGAATAGSLAASAARDSKDKKKVRKAMSASAWGVEHGGEVSKREKFNSREKLTGAVGALTGPIGGGVAAGAQAKKGKGAKVGFNAGGRAAGQAALGGGAGSALGLLASRGNQSAASIGGAVGSMAGGTHGAMASMRNSRRKGWTKP